MSTSIPPPPLNFNNSSFAMKTIRDRWPVILAQTVDSLYRFRREYEAHGIDMDKLKALTGSIGELRHEILTNKPITKFTINVANDLDLWNTQLNNRGITLMKRPATGITDSDTHPNWYSLPWLFMECYLYRRVAEAVGINGLSLQLDPFSKKKSDGFKKSLPFMYQLLQFLETSLSVQNVHDVDRFCKLFLQVALWANEFDLSLNLDENFSIEKREDLIDHVLKMSDRLVVNDTDILWDIWHARHQTPPSSQVTPNRKAIIVLDNCGPELLADLCFGEFILHHGLVHHVDFYPKMMPWFVSDVTMTDFDLMLHHGGLLSSDVPEPMRDMFHRWATHWQARVEHGEFSVRSSSFWTLPCSYDELHVVDPVLHEQMIDQSVDVIFFKGDLNYRKICADRTWTPDKLEHKLAAFRPLQLGRPLQFCTCNSHIPHPTDIGVPLDCRCSIAPDDTTPSPPPLVVALRVVKADVAVGLTPAMLDRVLSEASDDWWVIGRYGMIQIISPINFGG